MLGCSTCSPSPGARDRTVLWEGTAHAVRAAGPPARGMHPLCLELRALPTSLGTLCLGAALGPGAVRGRVVWAGRADPPRSPRCCRRRRRRPRAARGRFVSEIVPHPLSLKASKCLLEVWAASEVWEGCGCGSIRPRRAQHCCSGDAGLCCELSLPAAASSCRVGAPEGRLVC